MKKRKLIPSICLLQELDGAANKAAGFAGMQQTLLRQATISEEDQVGGKTDYESCCGF